MRVPLCIGTLQSALLLAIGTHWWWWCGNGQTWPLPGQTISVKQRLLERLSFMPKLANHVKLTITLTQFQNLVSRPANESGSRINLSASTSTLALEGKPLLDEVLVQRSLGHFVRERIPERVVHAKGSTFYGIFKVTSDAIAHYTRASVFSGVGTQTRVAVRVSTSLGERGSADTAFGEVRGFGVKFYTSEGNYDQLCINLPVFFINDPQLFPQLTHAQKRDPRTDFRSGNNLWDFFSLRPETLNTVTFLYSDYGLPATYRHMPAFSVNAFRLTNSVGRHCYAKFVWLPSLGIRNLNLSEAIALSGNDPDYARRDMFDAIENKLFPSWTLYVQVITLEEVHSDFTYNPFDATKLWPLDKYPLQEVGKMTLTHNVRNAFAENEQIALNPANLVSGIEPSPDLLLRGRLFAYRETQLYRLGTNHLLIPVNQESVPVVSERDGSMRTDGNLGSVANFVPNSKVWLQQHRPSLVDSALQFGVAHVVSVMADSVHQHYHHARQTYRSFGTEHQRRLHRNLAFALCQVTNRDILDRVLTQLHRVDQFYAQSVIEQLQYCQH